jgi:hypothetical protein
MELLRTLQPIVLRTGDVIGAGEIIQAKDPERLLAAGKARRLTHEENERVLDAYYEEAEKVFGKATTEAARPERKTHIQETLL